MTNENDLIRRADAIEFINSGISLDTDADREYATEMLKNIPSAEAVQGWIPCSERLPEKDELVLVTVWYDVTIACRNIYGGWESAEDMYEKGDVTAWMTLPDPYEGGDSE